MGMGTFAANHEFMNSQYEINLRHAPGADRRRPRVPAQERGQGRRRACTGWSRRSWASRSTTRAARASTSTSAPTATTTTRSPTATTPTACRDELRRFTAGVLAHAPALMAFLNPTINAYRRIVPDSLAPINVNWGWDNRTSVHPHPGRARARHARRDARSATAARTRTSAIAATLFAGLHGLREELPLARPVGGDALHARRAGRAAVPLSLEAALDALEADELPARRDRRRDRRRRSWP